MIGEISIQNFKSVEKLTLPLGRVNVLIGENGAGKSNVLEAIALLSAAAADKLDGEFLFSRGVRVTNDSLMCSAFPTRPPDVDEDGYAIVLTARNGENARLNFRLIPSPSASSKSVSKWVNWLEPPEADSFTSLYEQSTEAERKVFRSIFEKVSSVDLKPVATPATKGDITESLKDVFRRILYNRKLAPLHQEAEQQLRLSHFLIYSPENTALRRFEEEGQIQPVGIRGEGLFKMLQTFGGSDQADRLAELKQSLELIGWFLDFRVPPNLAPGESRLQIIDRFLGDNVPLDQRSANEGFLFLLFYFAVFLSKSTPSFFAIDNIDASLNPRLCAELTRRLVELAKKYDKQVILTTHNPAILDGLDLRDDDQRLFAISRDHQGRTKAQRIPAPKVREGDAPLKLSHAFLRGLLGGVPKNF